MSGHGAPLYGTSQTKAPEARQEEAKKIETYSALERLVRTKIREQEFTPETLQKTSELLSWNPEYYTIWNYRRLVLRDTFSVVAATGPDDQAADQIASMIKSELQFLFPLLRKFPKCYWIWNHRRWVLEEARILLPTPVARQFWQEELALVGKMLSMDNRNFHGWGYRRAVIEVLENFPPDKKSMAQEEFDYTTKMIKTNLSNFSAWHNRTKLIQRLLDEKSASDEERKKMLDDELALIHRAFFDPYDQSLWFYHQNLMCTFDPALAPQTMAPNLTNAERLDYIQTEIEKIKDMLDGDDDCKWIYQSLIGCTLLAAKIEGAISAEAKACVSGWLNRLKELDPLRRGRWLDLESSLNS
ncbi:hypothetical protein DTO271D3_7044 [Paecilomyces variotii]|nr:hypothetical protein DTO271D3_7044 [Paecilomyces variotii]